MEKIQNQDTIQRWPHDKDNPYVMVLHELVRDENISPNCRWLLIYLLSNEKGWVIIISQIAKHVKNHLGRDSVRKIVKEAIEAGYMYREEYSVNNLKRYKYYVSERPVFKKCYRCTEFQETGNQYSKEGIYEENKIIKKVIIAPADPPSPDPETHQLPAGGNNNVFLFLNDCEDLTQSQKRKLMKHSAKLVQQAVRYAYHPTTEITGGAIGRFKLIQYFLKNPDDFNDKMAELDELPKPKPSKKDRLLGDFKRGEVYNGYEYLQDDIGVGFLHSNGIHSYGVKYNEPNFKNKFMQLLKKLGIQIKNTNCS